MEAESKQCSNCMGFFPQDKIDLHQAYCCRNIRKCKLCSAMVDINNQEQHDNEFHNKKVCAQCNGEFMPDVFATHPKVCPRRPVVCKYCENQYAFSQHSKHQQICGMRTRPCTVCQRPIMLKDVEAHESRCQNRRQQRAQVSQDQYRQNHRYRERPLGQRERQISTNNIREGTTKSNSIQKINRPHKVKPHNIIGPQQIKPVIDPVPISVRLAMKAKQQRLPLKSKN